MLLVALLNEMLVGACQAASVAGTTIILIRQNGGGGGGRGEGAARSITGNFLLYPTQTRLCGRPLENIRGAESEFLCNLLAMTDCT